MRVCISPFNSERKKKSIFFFFKTTKKEKNGKLRMSVEVLGNALWPAEVAEQWVVREGGGWFSPASCGWTKSHLSTPLLSMWGVRLARGTCSDMGAHDWFAANSGKGQAALCSLLLFPQSHCCILFSTAIPCFMIGLEVGTLVWAVSGRRVFMSFSLFCFIRFVWLTQYSTFLISSQCEFVKIVSLRRYPGIT